MSEHPGLTCGPVYLDYNATTPVDPRVVEAMQPFLGPRFGNPSSGYGRGATAASAVIAARDQVARLIGARADEIVFTGSGSEADNLAIRGAVLGAAGTLGPPHVITQATEHPAVLATCAALARLHGVEVTYLPVDRYGLVDPAELAARVTDRTVLVSVMLANNETGTIQPVAELARIAHERGVLLHTDAAQAVGKVPVNVTELGVDLLTLVGHKMYAPKGIGALYVRCGVALEPVVYGGGQEHGLRAGTENVAAIVALGAAADLAAFALAHGESERVRRLRDELHRRLADTLPGPVALNGHPTRRLPNTVNLSVAAPRADALLAAATGVAASTGSACHTGDPSPSPVLTAMGVPEDLALSAIRLSLGRWSTADDIDRACERLLGAATAGPQRQGRGRSASVHPARRRVALAGPPQPCFQQTEVGEAMSTTVNTEELTAKVQAMYRLVAERPHATYHFELGRPLALRLGYAAGLLDQVPAAAVESFAGVGYFFDLADLGDGDLVLDLGSGSGMDACCAARLVGPGGRVIGVDFTGAQLAKARGLVAEAGLANVEFREGHIESLPVDDASIDCVISNGVVNLCPDKERVFAEAARVLRPGGRLAIADIVAEKQLTDAIVCNVDLWASCIGGAAQQDEYRRAIESAGLRVVETRTNPYEFISDQARNASGTYGVKSVSVLAIKPANHSSHG